MLAYALLAIASAVSASVTPATYDGTCYYPVPDPSFPSLSDYMGRWYQVAGTIVPFTLGCSCIYADYTLNIDSTVNVTNACQLGLLPSSISGVAAAVNTTYGSAGALKVSFPSVPVPDDCPGPNYIIQRYTRDWAIVQSSGFSTLFLLSRSRNVTDAQIDTWLAEAEQLGSDLSSVMKFGRESCLFA